MNKGFTTENTEIYHGGHAAMRPAPCLFTSKLRALCGKKAHLVLVVFIAIISSCKNKSSSTAVRFNFPEAGTKLKAGEDLIVDLQFDGSTADSIVYLIDTIVATSKADTSNFKLSTKDLTLGNHLLTAKVYNGGDAVEITSNIVILAVNPPAPYTFKVVNIYPHDTSSYVEGLEYHDGMLYESDGGKSDNHGGSSLRLTALKTGKIIRKVDIPDFFAEGITIVGDKIIQLTWKDKVGFVYDKKSFKKLSEFPYLISTEGWGLAFDGKQLLSSDGSNTIYFLNKNTFQLERSIEVYDDKGAIDQLNELEYIDGKIYANVYGEDIILVINPLNGQVENVIDFSSLFPKEYESNKMEYVLNGIAWDKAGKRLFITGKLWDKLYEIQLIKK